MRLSGTQRSRSYRRGRRDVDEAVRLLLRSALPGLSQAPGAYHRIIKRAFEGAHQMSVAEVVEQLNQERRPEMRLTRQGGPVMEEGIASGAEEPCAAAGDLGRAVRTSTSEDRPQELLPLGRLRAKDNETFGVIERTWIPDLRFTS